MLRFGIDLGGAATDRNRTLCCLSCSREADVHGLR
jgi:hypothetical protein